MAVDANPETIAALWQSLGEPVRAAVLATTLGLILAFRSSERGILKRLLEVVAGGVTGLLIGFILDMANFDSWVIWSSNVAIAYLGVDKVRAIIDHYVDRYVYKKEA